MPPSSANPRGADLFLKATLARLKKLLAHAVKARLPRSLGTELGRKNEPEDITEFLWGIDVGKYGRAALVISEKAELLKQAGAAAIVADLGENWEKPKQ